MKRILGLCLALSLLGLGYWVTGFGYERLTQFRQIERLPQVPVNAVLPGEVNLQGQVEALSADNIIIAPDSRRPVVYYRYHIEREVRDSEGKRSWQTVSDTYEYVPFLLRDATGAIRIDPNVRASMPRSNRRIDGNMRYSEYNIEPNDEVFVLGYAVQRGPQGGMVVAFTVPGSYTPILSRYGEARERGSMAAWSVAFIVLGVTLLSAGVYVLAWVIRLHKTIVFVLLTALVVFVTLLVQGLQMAQADVEDALQRLQEHEQQVALLMRENLPSSTEDRLQAIADHLALRQGRVADLIRLWPERRFVPEGINIAQTTPVTDVGFQPTRLGFWSTLAFVLGGMAAVGVALPFGIRRIKLKRLMENLPTTDLGGVVFGLNEVQGIACVSAQHTPLVGPLTGDECVTYRYTIEEKRKSGKSAQWVVVERDEQWASFDLKALHEDSASGTQRFCIKPEGSEFIVRDRVVKTEGKRRYTETRIKPGTPIYVLGTAQVADERAELEMRQATDDAPFVVSDLAEHELMLRKAGQAFALFSTALVGGVALALGVAGQSGQFGVLPYLWCAAVPLVYWLVLVIVLIYNDLVFLRQRIKQTDANVDVALKKRADVLPLLETVTKTYLAHEQDVQLKLAELRQQWQQTTWNAQDRAQFVAQEHALQQQIMARLEEYPDLKGDASMRLLMTQLTRLEDEISLMRIGYTQAIEQYNTRRGQLPDVIVAGLTGFKPETAVAF